MKCHYRFNNTTHWVQCDKPPICIVKKEKLTKGKFWYFPCCEKHHDRFFDIYGEAKLSIEEGVVEMTLET